MEQYSSGSIDIESATKPVTVTPETKKIHAIDEAVKSLQEKIIILQQEILRQGRDIGRLKNDIDSLTNAIRNRG
jgi:peptidoglycan hydrolase CwlO-like protein